MEDPSSEEEEEDVSPFPQPERTRAPAARMRAYAFLSFIVRVSFLYSAGVQALPEAPWVMTPISVPST